MPSSNTAANSNGAPGKPFKKGDPRINRKGRPKSFDALRELAQQIAHEQAQAKDKDGTLHPVVIDGHVATTAELMLRKWFASNDTRLQIQAMEIAFGKVPQQLEHSGPEGGPLTIATRVIRAKDDAETGS